VLAEKKAGKLRKRTSAPTATILNSDRAGKRADKIKRKSQVAIGLKEKSRERNAEIQGKSQDKKLGGILKM
jgi:hypothetical protein